MLPPDSRATLLEQLRPPLGYHLEHCVGTTFTLHLTSALLPPLAFTSLGLRGSHDPVSMLSALRDVSDRIDLFCQTGQIAVPRQPSSLLALLESTVHQMAPPRSGHLFHPKVWVCSFRPEPGDGGDEAFDDLDRRYRLLVMSRNLTDDSCWDTVVSLDGTATRRPTAQNRPLAEFLRYLTTHTVHRMDQARAERIHALAEQVRRVQWTAPEGLELTGFHPLGVARTPIPDFTGSKTLIVSPFLTDDGLATTASDGELTVISTAEALEHLDEEAADWIDDAYVISPDADLRDPDEQGAEDRPTLGARILTGLHAKVYVVERNRKAHLLVGSANATDAAFYGNVEFLVEFSGRVKDVGAAAMLAGDSLGAITVPYPKPFGGVALTAEEEARRHLDRVIRDIAAVPTTATVTTDEAAYAITVTTDSRMPLPEGYRATVELHTARGRAVTVDADRPLHARFTDLTLVEVTALVLVTVTSPEGLEGSCVIIADLVGDPPGRFDAIVASQLDTPEKFLRFLALLLGLTGDSADAVLGTGGADSAARGRYLTSGLFEQLLAGLADNREALRSLDAIVARMTQDSTLARALPDGFPELWSVVQEALTALEGAPA